MSIFTPADILLPPYAPKDGKWTGYSVIACDQFTGEKEYWSNAEDLANPDLSTLDYILPEAYLETEREEPLNIKIAENMKTVTKKLVSTGDCLVYLERTLPDGRIRHGIVGKIDLEQYDFSAGSTSPVRATEKTVLERVPPRVKIRSSASVEFPHVMIFCDDPENNLFKAVKVGESDLLYDFDLMLGGGHARGYKVQGSALDSLTEAINAYESSKTGVIYAVGDGNHSLAAAKSHYENVKKALGDAAKDHPARFALCEIVNIHDSAIEFEPIYRIVNNCNVDKLLTAYGNVPKTDDDLYIIIKGKKIAKKAPAGHALTVGALQDFIDSYIKNEENGAKCDYIHGEDSLTALSMEENTVAFSFTGLQKEDLFAYVTENGVLPRKTFSMGEAKSKRYYLEARYILH